MKKLLHILAVIGFLLAGCSKIYEPQNSEAVLVIEKSDDGIIKDIGYKVNGKKTGEWKEFVRHQLKSIINYRNGVEHGIASWYNLCSETIVREGHYDMGKPVGLWYLYLYGELTSISEYKTDTLEIVYYNPKFKSDGPPPPPPPANSIYDCSEYGEY